MARKKRNDGEGVFIVYDNRCDALTGSAQGFAIDEGALIMAKKTYGRSALDSGRYKTRVQS